MSTEPYSGHLFPAGARLLPGAGADFPGGRWKQLCLPCPSPLPARGLGDVTTANCPLASVLARSGGGGEMPSHRDTALPAASWCRAGSEPALALLHVEVAVSRPEVPLPPWGFPGSSVLPSSCPAAGAHPLPPCSPTEVCLCIPHAAVILGGCSQPCAPLGFHVGSGAAKDGGQEGDGAVGQPHSAPCDHPQGSRRATTRAWVFWQRVIPCTLPHSERSPWWTGKCFLMGVCVRACVHTLGRRCGFYVLLLPGRC